ncbi:Protein of unknown function [Gryllus bimaculatus]|nr:Protein of unknown function [Gryllus bimaculatus]
MPPVGLFQVAVGCRRDGGGGSSHSLPKREGDDAAQWSSSEAGARAKLIAANARGPRLAL